MVFNLFSSGKHIADLTDLHQVQLCATDGEVLWLVDCGFQSAACRTAARQAVRRKWLLVQLFPR
jgi:hypothetical protein